MVNPQITGRAAGGVPRRSRKSLLPTRKWWAATVTALGAVAVLWLNQGQQLTTVVWIAVVGAAVQAVTTYLVPNDNTPGGVPERAA